MSTSVAALCNDVVLDILQQAQLDFSHHSAQQLFCSTALVHKELLHQSQILLLRNVHLRDSKSALLFFDFIAQRPELHQHIRSIHLTAAVYDLNKAHQVWSGLAALLPSCTRLRTLQIDSVPTFVAKRVFQSILTRAMTLKHLSIGTPVPHDTTGYFMAWNWFYIAPFLRQLPYLTSLSLPGVTPLGEDQFMADEFFLTAAERFSKLEHTSLEKLELSDALLPKETLSDILATFPQLKELDVQRPHQLSAERLYSALEHAPSLRQFTFAFNGDVSEELSPRLFQSAAPLIRQVVINGTPTQLEENRSSV